MTGFLGYPTTDEICGLVRAGCYQGFEGGTILWTPTKKAIASHGAIRTEWASYGYERGRLGYPVAEESCTTPGNGCYQTFEHGTIWWSASAGTHPVWGAVLGAYRGQNTAWGWMGYPTGDEDCSSPGAGCFQRFQNASVWWSPSTGAKTVRGAILGAYRGQNTAWGWMGYPTGDEDCSSLSSGCFQRFESGTIWWSSRTGAHPVRGGILSLYRDLNTAWGRMGYPIGSERCTGSSCVQKFQTGTITWENGYTGTQAYNECEKLNIGASVYSGYGARNVSFAIAEGYGRADATFIRCRAVAGLYVRDWSVNGYVGASGFKAPGVPSGPTRFEYSPTGSFSVTEAFGLGDPGTALPYTTLNPRSRWGGNPWTSTYNTYFESDSWVGYDENMWYFATRPSGDYTQGAVINYNRPPDSSIVQDAGFAIFLHENVVPTAGCISIPHNYLVDWLQKAIPGDRIIMGVRAELFR